MIAEGKMPAKVVYEDDEVIAFDDIMPQAPVHTLIVPRAHFRDLSDDIDEGLVGRLMAIVPKIADLKGVTDSGYRLIVNTGRDASQSVGHLHIHLLGGKQMSHGMVHFEDED
jgi:histidine triad (HIT) family protein